MKMLKVGLEWMVKELTIRKKIVNRKIRLQRALLYYDFFSVLSASRKTRWNT